MNQNEIKTIVLVGQPNSGKSTLLNVISDIKTNTSNYPGTTDKLNASLINIYGKTFKIIDLPGVYSLNSSSTAEDITLEFLLNEKYDLIVNVVDASLLVRSLELTVELVELGKPMIISLNMLDDAESHGLDIDIKKLEEILNIPVIPTMAIYGKGVKQLVETVYYSVNKKNHSPKEIKYTHHLEVRINSLEEDISALNEKLNGSSRFYALKAIESPDLVPKNILQQVRTASAAIEKECQDLHKMDGFEAISYERHHLAMKLSEDITKFRQTRKRPFVDSLDNFLMHPYWGYLSLVIFFFLYFCSIFLFGGYLSSISEIPIGWLGNTYSSLKLPYPFLWSTINGIYYGFSGIFGIVLPYFLPLMFLTAYFEETGYIARIAFLVDGIMHKIGLHGKSVVPFILGFGCSVPAIYATRMIDNKRDKMITGILIPFIPCSARIAVIFALTAAFTGPIGAIVVFFYVIIIITLIGSLMTKFLSKPMGLILEIPRLKIPSLKITFSKTIGKVFEFFKDAVTYLIAGSIILSWIEYFHVGNFINKAFSPILKNVLGLPEQLGSTLLFGFFRKELIIVMANQALGVSNLAMLPLTPQQIIVFVIFVTLYFPCFTTFVVIWKEFSAKVVIISALLSIILATISSLIFRLIFLI